MAFRDTWHRALVYFGLAEDEAYEEELDSYGEPEVELQDSYSQRPNVRRLSARRRRDEIDDIFADDIDEDRRTAPLRPVGGPRNGRGEVRVHFVAPKSFNDVQDVADKFKDAIPVILNLQGTDTDLAKRLIDFSSGLTYAVDGPRAHPGRRSELRQRAVLRLHPDHLHLHPHQLAVRVRATDAVLAMVGCRPELPQGRLRAVPAAVSQVHPADWDVRLLAVD